MEVTDWNGSPRAMVLKVGSPDQQHSIHWDLSDVQALSPKKTSSCIQNSEGGPCGRCFHQPPSDLGARPGLGATAEFGAKK